jgi:hypothetical protein
MNKEKLFSIGKDTMSALSLIVSVITIIDFGVGMARKYQKPKTVTGFTAAASTSTEDKV